MGFFRDRIFFYAILISVAWHIFWLSAIAIVSTAPGPAAVKFSKVSFLGPILERGPIEMRIESRQRSVLDKRYLSDLERGVPETDNLQVRYSKPAEESAGLDFQGLSEAKFSSFVKGAVSSPKVEPDF